MLLTILAVHQQHVQLAKPLATKSVINVPKLVPSPASFLHVPPGFKVDLYVDGLRHPRMMAVSENGDLFVVETRIEVREKNQPNRVTVLWKSAGSNKPDHRKIYADKLNLPFGIQFGFGFLYVANTGSVVRWPYKSGDHVAPSEPETVLDGIPQDGYRNHWTRNIRFSPDFKTLFLTIGSEQNVAAEGERRAVIESYSLDSGGRITGGKRIVANGMRNPIGLDFNPVSGALWANVAERDYLGDELVPDYLTEVKSGGFYGWPYYYIGPHLDPRMVEMPRLKGRIVVPDVLFPAHTTPIDVKFCRGDWYRGDAIVALHGSQNRSQLMGYKVVRVRFKGGKATGKFEDFVTGWLPKGSNKKIYGRPAGLAFLADGSLLIADDWGGRIWRVRKMP